MVDRKVYGPWLVLDRLGRGGQGDVFRALDTRKVSIEDSSRQLARASFELRQGNISPADVVSWSGQLRQGLSGLAAADDPANMGALKILAPYGRWRRSRKSLRPLSERAASLFCNSSPEPSPAS